MPQESLPHTDPAPMVVQVNSVQPLEAYRSLVLTTLKWKMLILGLGLLLATAAAITLALQPPVWSARAKLLLKGERLSLQVPGLGSAGPGSRSASSEELATAIEFMESAAVLLPVARALRAADNGAVDVPDRELRGEVGLLRSRIDVTTVPNTSVLQVTYSSESQTEAEDTLALIVAHYIEQHTLAYSGGARLTAFYEQEMQETAEDLRRAEDRFREWQHANNVVTLDAQINGQVALFTELDAGLKRTEVEIGAARAAIVSLTGQVAAQPEESVASRQRSANPMVAKLKGDLATAEGALQDTPPTPLVSRLKTDLVTAQIALNDLRQRYRDPDRRVVEKLEQIALIEREIATAEREAAAIAADRVATLKAQLAEAERDGEVLQSEMIARNPLREGLARELAGTKARLTSLLSQADALRGQLKEADKRLAALRAKQGDFDRLSRNVELAKAVYLTNSKRLDDSRIVAGLEKQHLSNVALIEAPRSAPGKTLTYQLTLVALAGVVGLGVGVVAAFGTDLLTGTPRTPEEVEFHLGIPVVTVVPLAAGTRPARAFPLNADIPSAPPGA